jgi:hypothetical protein
MDDRDQFADYVEKGAKWDDRYAANDISGTNKKFVEFLKSKGHDGIIIKGTEYDAKKSGLKTIDQIVSFDTKNVLTRKQLTDIWNEANKKTATGAWLPELPKQVKVEPIDTTGGKISGVAKSIEAKAVESRLTEGYKDIAEFPSSSFKAEAKKSSDLVNSDINKARAIIRGEEQTEIKSGALISAMEEYAKNNPKDAADIFQELANSPLATKISTGASETSFARMREPDTASAKLQSVKKLREESVRELPKKKKIGKDNLKKEIEKINLSKEDLSWSNFLDKITC